MLELGPFCRSLGICSIHCVETKNICQILILRGKQRRSAKHLQLIGHKARIHCSARCAQSSFQLVTKWLQHLWTRQVKTCKTMLSNVVKQCETCLVLVKWSHALILISSLLPSSFLAICCQCCRPFRDRVNCQPSRSFLRS